MNELLKKFEDLWVSVAFAEAGEHEASKHVLINDASDEGCEKICQPA